MSNYILLVIIYCAQEEAQTQKNKSQMCVIGYKKKWHLIPKEPLWGSSLFQQVFQNSQGNIKSS